MKKLLLLAIAVVVAQVTDAQVQTPQPSPFSKVEQKVGLTDVTLEYSRPGVKGRKIFGGLESYDKIWRTGANKNTIITFSDPVTIEGKQLAAGSYAIFTKPGKENWEVYFYSDTNNWGVPQEWDNNKVAVSVTVQAHEVPFNVETFTIDINSITNNGAAIEFIWETTYLAVPFEVPTDNKVLTSINDTLNGSPTAQDYFNAAVYFSQENKDIKQAKEWVDKAISMSEKPAFWQLRHQSLIYAKAGDKKGAIEIAKKSLQASKEAGNEQYVKFNEESLKEWGAM